MERTDDRQVKSSICLLFSEKLFTWTLPLVVYHACKASQPDQIFYPHFPYLLLKPSQKLKKNQRKPNALLKLGQLLSKNCRDTLQGETPYRRPISPNFTISPKKANAISRFLATIFR